MHGTCFKRQSGPKQAKGKPKGIFSTGGGKGPKPNFSDFLGMAAVGIGPGAEKCRQAPSLPYFTPFSAGGSHSQS